MPTADPNLVSVEDNARVPDHMHGLLTKNRLAQTKARIAARPTGRAADSGGAVLALAGFGLLGLGLIVGSQYRK